MLALLSLAARSECLDDCTNAAAAAAAAATGSIDNEELVGALEFESTECGDCSGDLDLPFVCDMLTAVCPPDADIEWFVDSLCIE